jgi:hypothetical protein
MAMKMATKALAAVLMVIVVALQWTALQARSVPGDFDTQEYVPTNGAYEEFDPQDLNSDASMPSFATESDVTPGTTWDAEAFSSQDPLSATEPSTDQSTYNSDDASFATTEAELPFDTFVDSPETITTPDPTTSLADDTAVAAPPPVYTQAQYDNDEVSFDTSSADTVYRATDK